MAMQDGENGGGAPRAAQRAPGGVGRGLLAMAAVGVLTAAAYTSTFQSVLVLNRFPSFLRPRAAASPADAAAAAGVDGGPLLARIYARGASVGEVALAVRRLNLPARAVAAEEDADVVLDLTSANVSNATAAAAAAAAAALSGRRPTEQPVEIRSGRLESLAARMVPLFGWTGTNGPFAGTSGSEVASRFGAGLGGSESLSGSVPGGGAPGAAPGGAAAADRGSAGVATGNSTFFPPPQQPNEGNGYPERDRVRGRKGIGTQAALALPVADRAGVAAAVDALDAPPLAGGQPSGTVRVRLVPAVALVPAGEAQAFDLQVQAADGQWYSATGRPEAQFRAREPRGALVPHAAEREVFCVPLETRASAGRRVVVEASYTPPGRAPLTARALVILAGR